MKSVVFLCCLLVLAGCGVHVVPQPSPSVTLNPADNSLTARSRNVTVSARVQDLDVLPYGTPNYISSFYVAVVNGTPDVLSLPLESFFLVDGQGNQLHPLPPEDLQQVTLPDSQYLIPYPYVGFYYLEDYAKFGFFNTLSSERPYFAENPRQDLYIRALKAGEILPGARAGGEIYFPIDLATREKIELRLYLPGTPLSSPADFVFPFRVEK